MSVTLSPMTKEYYKDFYRTSLEHHALELSREGNITPEAAACTAEQELDEMLPMGMDTPGHYLMTVCSNGVPAGYLWFLTEESDGMHQAFLCDFRIEEACRRRGTGKAAMAEFQKAAAALGCAECTLFVEGCNSPARALYEKCGYGIVKEHNYGFYLKKILC